jgi:hypothetical protein
VDGPGFKHYEPIVSIRDGPAFRIKQRRFDCHQLDLPTEEVIEPAPAHANVINLFVAPA